MRNTTIANHFIGFDLLVDTLQQGSRGRTTSPAYPPYNIIKLDGDSVRIEIAATGLSVDQIEVTLDKRTLIVEGNVPKKDTSEYVHHGLSCKPWTREFVIAEYMEVSGVSLKNGLLAIDIIRNIPEEQKPKRISINSSE